MRRLGVALTSLLFALTVACQGGAGTVVPVTADEPRVPAVTTPEATPSPPPSIEPTAATPVPSATTPAAPTPATPPPATPTPVPATARPPAAPARAPSEGRWIDLDLTRLTVRFMDGTATLRTIGPVGVGREIDSGVWESTATGLFRVYNKTEALVYDAPYRTYISHWVGFDPSLANGFHSFLKDKDGKVVDASTGYVSNGCIRTPEPDAIYAFAQVGMPVWVHR